MLQFSHARIRSSSVHAFLGMDSPQPLMTHRAVLGGPSSPIAQVGQQEVRVSLELCVKLRKPLLQARRGQHQAVSRHAHVEALREQHSTVLQPRTRRMVRLPEVALVVACICQAPYHLFPHAKCGTVIAWPCSVPP